MPYRVTVAGEISRLRAGDAGSRNVRIDKGTPKERILTFNRMPTYLEEVPPEVEADAMLVVREVSTDDMEKAGGRLLARDAPGSSEASDAEQHEEDDFEEDLVEDTVVVEGDVDPDSVNKSNTKKPRQARKRAPRKAKA